MGPQPKPREREVSAAPPRETESREATSRPKVWQPASLLPDPEPQEGYTFRWVRESTMNEPDALNVNRQQREGFEKVSVEEQPALKMLGSTDGSIRTGGLILMKRSVEITESHKKAIDEMTARQFESADAQLLRENNPRTNMRIDRPERSTQVSFSSRQ